MPSVGWWPDPILDFQHSADIAKGDCQAFWVRVRAPQDQPPGLYRGKLTVDLAGEPALAMKDPPGAVKSAIFRFRRRYHELIREEVGHTVADMREIEEELRYLLKMLAAMEPISSPGRTGSPAARQERRRSVRACSASRSTPTGLISTSCCSGSS